MTLATGLGLLDVSILEAIDTAGARHDQPYLKTQRVLDVLHERTGIGPNQAYESLCDMARPYVVHLPLVDFHGNYGSPDFGPAAPRYTECRLTKLGEAALAAERANSDRSRSRSSTATCTSVDAARRSTRDGPWRPSGKPPPGHRTTRSSTSSACHRSPRPAPSPGIFRRCRQVGQRKSWSVHRCSTITTIDSDVRS